MDVTTKKGREAISLMLQGKRIAAQFGHGDGAPEWAFVALAHIDNLERECDSLRAELERAREVLAGLMRAYEAFGGLTMDGSWHSHAKAFLATPSATPNGSAVPVTPPLEEGPRKGGRMPFPSSVRERPEPPAASYKPSEEEIRALDAALASYGVHAATLDAILRELLTTIANARRTP